MDPFRIFIGYDERESIAYHVLAHSIIRQSSVPVAIVPLVKKTLIEYDRPKLETESTDFSFTRFLVPYLSGYQGVSLFMDCDMLVRCDIGELYTAAYVGSRNFCPEPAVWCVQHDYTPKDAPKMDGVPQTRYPRKNWSSVMLFNNARCMGLGISQVNSAPAAWLHEMHWADKIGQLPDTFNWLVDEYPHNDQAKILHYTLGGPWFQSRRYCDHAADWQAEWLQMRNAWRGL